MAERLRLRTSRALEVVLEKLIEEGVQIGVYRPLRDAVQQMKEEDFTELEYVVYDNEEELDNFDPDFLISLGGDGTILDATVLIQSKDIPILGINMGRLGFWQTSLKAISRVPWMPYSPEIPVGFQKPTPSAYVLWKVDEA